MANPNISEIITTTMWSRTGKLADNMTKNNALLYRLNSKDRVKKITGGNVIRQELMYAENTNTQWFSGYDVLNTAAQDVITSAQFNIKQASTAVTMSGLEMLQNAGKERMIDLMEGRISVAESTMANLISQGLYSDGTSAGGKQIDGLNAALPVANTTGTYGGINRATWTFWQNQLSNQTAANGLNPTLIGGYWNALWASCVRGSDAPDLIMCDTLVWNAYVAACQAIQRFNSPEVGELGFASLKFMNADVVLDGGIGGQCPTGTAFFLNTDFIHYRPHASRNMVPLSPNKRYATNQDAEVQILAWAGNLTCSGTQFNGRYDANG